MIFNTVNINFPTLSFFQEKNLLSFQETNTLLKNKTGIVDFFEKEEDFVQLKEMLEINENIVSESRVEYGDFQTNKQLAESVCKYLHNKNISPKILLEPTCGKGNFILSAIKRFSSLEQVFGIEIQEKYLWHLKFELLEYFLNNPTDRKSVV